PVQLELDPRLRYIERLPFARGLDVICGPYEDRGRHRRQLETLELTSIQHRVHLSLPSSRHRDGQHRSLSTPLAPSLKPCRRARMSCPGCSHSVSLPRRAPPRPAIMIAQDVPRAPADIQEMLGADAHRQITPAPAAESLVHPRRAPDE